MELVLIIKCVVIFLNFNVTQHPLQRILLTISISIVDCFLVFSDAVSAAYVTHRVINETRRRS
jgi:hypothetical protein